MFNRSHAFPTTSIRAWLGSSSLGRIMVENYLGPMIKFTATNYSFWKSMMEDFLNCKDLYDHIEGDNAKPSEMPNTDWKKLKKKTLGAICQWVDISLYNHVAKETDP